MKESRSASQILFGFLPQQTVDIKGGVWKVKRWRSPKLERNVDMATLRKELRRLASPWRAHDLDGGFVNDLERGGEIRVLSLDKDNGVELEPFPEIWICHNCKRLHQSPDQRCQCGHTGKKGQFHFVGYHDACGAIKQPFIPRCPTHKQVKIHFPGTSTATELKFECPVCNSLLRKGFGFPRCDCGTGQLSFNVHRSSTVYTPRSIVIVNPPSPEKIRAITDAGGRPRALSWVLGGMEEGSLEEIKPSLETLRQQLLSQGIASELVEGMIRTARESGQIPEGSGIEVDLDHTRRIEAEDQAITIALAASGARMRISDLEHAVEPMSELGILYRDKYRVALRSAGLNSIELIEKFPVLTGQFGFTRGGTDPSKSRLKTFRHSSGAHEIYADLAETEALFVRLSAVRIADWLTRVKGHPLEIYVDETSARVAILKAAEVPGLEDHIVDSSVGVDILTLIHSYCHRFIRQAGLWAGIERNALSELLVPLHLGFYVYAAARGDFVLGGLQAVFESELDRLLYSFVHDEQRCPLDPGCSRAGGACVACLHLGEPSCRLFNRFLSRHALFGATGFLNSSKD